MRATVIEKFGGPEVFHLATIPVPKIGDRDILVQVHMAGIGIWDPWIAEGGLGGRGRFPMVIGSDGSGTVVAMGPKVKRFKPGDHVYGYAYGNEKGGFFAEYTAIPEDSLAMVPKNISMDEAGVLAVSGITALLGLEELGLKRGQSIMIWGASGGVGHIALQIAKNMGARVLAVASGSDGVAFVRRLGADMAVDGRKEDMVEATQKFAPDGLDATLAFSSGPELNGALLQVRSQGRIAYPNGVEPEPRAVDANVVSYDGLPSPEVFDRLNRIIASGPFHVEIGQTYTMEEVGVAIQDVQKHHLGKLALRVRSEPVKANPEALSTMST
jgi:NADPH:quinone reductase-like Zn-dependent oxidoreductase